ncbi:uncharacterized protein LOC132832452 isoform X2 [Hemiscyllium ocellatum]|uniref:uncharacterized protein LOC132832452 isoform X2 n=1 Tax=Hemiscyllium ocellatum TaxID=170820 RepID=UPI0029663B8C|nr:uncharacterized protein LOC132832452 isoform X2 [Hemiscyllium ocellatum]
MCVLFRMSLLLGYFLYWTIVQAEMHVYRTPGSSVFFPGVDEEQKNKAQHFRWKFSNGNAEDGITKPVLQFQRGDMQPSVLKMYRGRLDFFRNNGSLILHHLTSSDEGLYTLQINLQNSTAQAIHLRVIDELPQPSIFSNSSSLHSTIMLICVVSDQPQEYQWQKDGGNISEYHLLVNENRSLIIPNAQKNTCGVYTCIVINPVSSRQADYIVTIYGIASEQYVIIAAAIVGLIFSAVSFVTLMLQCCLNEELSNQAQKKFFLILLVGNIISLIAILIALISWLCIQGVTIVPLATLLFVSIVLVFAVIAMINVWNMDCLCMKKFLSNAGFRGLLDGSPPLIPLIVIVISITILVEEIRQNNQGCSAVSLTWIMVGLILGIGFLIFVFYIAMWCYSNKERNRNPTPNDSQQDECVELQSRNSSEQDSNKERNRNPTPNDSQQG